MDLLLEESDPWRWWQVGNRQRDRNVTLLAVESNGMNLQFVSDDLRDDADVVRAAVRQRGSALQYASARLRNDSDTVFAAAIADPSAFRFASRELRNCREFVMSIVMNDSHALQFACASLQNDPVLVHLREEALRDEQAFLVSRELLWRAWRSWRAGQLSLVSRELLRLAWRSWHGWCAGQLCNRWRREAQALAQERTQMLHILLQLQNRTYQFRRTTAAWTQASRAAVRRGDLDADAELSAALLHWRLQAGASIGRRTGARVGG